MDHPDVLEFIDCKADSTELNNFNISVGLTEVFMQAVKNDSDYDLIDPRDNHPTTTLNARQVYERMVERAWKNGEPGIVFLDRINIDNPTPQLGELESTNPCGEQPLLPMEACNLGSINLSRFVMDQAGTMKIDYASLKAAVHTAVHFLDNVIDISCYPLPAINEMVKGNRKIGLGVMGFADLLFRLEIPYNSDMALTIADDVMGFIRQEAQKASLKLAEQRGVFPNYAGSIFDGDSRQSFRNSTLTTIAPTGSLSIIAGCSSGIEPLFALSFTRTIMDNDQLLEVNPWFEAAAREHGFFSEKLMREVATLGSITAMDGIPASIKKAFVTAHDIQPRWHLRMQAAFQKHTDNAVSKTVNLPYEATVNDVRRIYDLAWELECKGVTIYRNGSRDEQVLSLSDTRKRSVGIIPPERPETLNGFTTRIKTGIGHLYLTVTEHEGNPFEVFAIIGKSGRSMTAKTEAIGRLVSLALRSGVAVEKVVEQLKGIGGEYPVFRKGGMVLSVPDAISRVLEERYLRGQPNNCSGSNLNGNTCPECGQKISFEEGCEACHFCGYSKCV